MPTIAGWRYLAPRVRLHLGEARGYLSSSQETYDLIQISLLDSASAASGGVYGLSESYLYTREAIAEYLQHLKPNGLLSITRWVKIPPRDGLKLLATSIEALRLDGVEQPGRQSDPDPGLGHQHPGGQKRSLRRRRDPGACWPSARPVPSIWPTIRASPRRRPIATTSWPSPTSITAPWPCLATTPSSTSRSTNSTSGRPAMTGPIFSISSSGRPCRRSSPSYRQGGVSLLELGYPVLVLTLLQAIAASSVLILLPILWLRHNSNPGCRHTGSVLLYFLAIGLGFMFIEIVFIQKFILFLAHPIQAVTVILCGFLIFSGLGSLFAQRLYDRQKNRRIYLIVTILAVISLVYLGLLPRVFAGLSDLPHLAKAGVTLALIAPLAFCMGMPFPLGLSSVTQSAPQLLPWAWGVNGCASLISAILATLLAIHLGFTWVVILALAAYGSAALLYPAMAGGSHGAIKNPSPHPELPPRGEGV